MSNPGEIDDTPITSARQLADHIAEGCKPKHAFRIGTEHEKFGFRRADRAPPAYAPDGIRAVLEGIGARGWSPILDRGLPIGLTGDKAGDKASVSLEPAGQLELSGAPLEDLHATKAEFDGHFDDVRAVSAPLGLGFAPLGFHPTATRAQMPLMPKSRYAIMLRYMPTRGALGLDMMLRTCTVQVNLDYASEADMVAKLRVSLLLQPVATALFANSPFIEGRPSGFLSSRARVWTDTDPDRTGIPAVVFEDGFGFERYVDWLLDVPMYLLSRDGGYVDVAGASFRDHMAGRVLDAPVVSDFADHMTTAFTDVRLKRFLEMRGADAGTPSMMLAQSALWVGLLYDDAALAAATALVERYRWQDLAALRSLVPRTGLDTTLGAAGPGTVRDLARDVVTIAADGLRARSRPGALGSDESAALSPLLPIVSGGATQAEIALARYNSEWQGDASRALEDGAI